MQDLINWFISVFGVPEHMQDRVVQSLIALAVLVGMRWLALRLVQQYAKTPTARYRARKAISYIFAAFVLLTVGRIFFEGLDDIATIFGLVGAGLVLVFREPIANVGGWLFILAVRPFELGDRIEVDGVRGDVVDIRLFEFTMLEIGNWVNADQSTGRIVHVPNMRVFDRSLSNYHKGFGFIWDEISVITTFESDWRHAKRVMTEIATCTTKDLSAQARENESRNSYLIHYENLTPIVYTSVCEYGVRLTLRFLTDPRQRRGTENALFEAILDAFAVTPDIEFAYPTQRFFNHATESMPTTTSSPATLGGVVREDHGGS